MAKRKALVCGINDYPQAINHLPSCVQDAQAFKRLLEFRFGFKPEDVSILTNGEVTRAAFQDGLRDLLAGADPDDRYVLFYSGHGYQQSANGVREEYLVLFDGLLHDDDLSRATQGVPPGVLTVVLDCCFGGGMEKVMQLLGAESASKMLPSGLRSMDRWTGIVPPGGVLKVWTPPDFQKLQADLLAARHAPRVKPFGRGVIGVERAMAGERKSFVLSAPSGDEAGQVPMKGLLVSACLEDETAAASTPTTNGLSAFTWSLTQVLGSSAGPLSTRDVVAKATVVLRMAGVGQTPQIKEPIAPPGSSSLSFIDLAAVRKQDESPGGDSASPVLEWIRLLLGKEQSMNGLDPSLLLQLLALSQKQQQGGDGSKGLSLDDIARLAGTIIPLLKARQAEPAGGEKGWMDLLPTILPLLKASPAPQQKNIFEDVLHAAVILGPILLKGQQQQATSKRLSDWFPMPPIGDNWGAMDKSWVDDAVRAISVLAPILSKGRSQAAPAQEKSVLGDLLPLIPILFA